MPVTRRTLLYGAAAAFMSLELFGILGAGSLRAADTLQLAAALIASNDHPESLPFVCLDDRLANESEWTAAAPLLYHDGRADKAMVQITWPTTLEITQTSSRIDVRSSTPQQLTQTMAYPLDGSEMTVRSPGDITTRATAAWQGATFVVTLPAHPEAARPC